MERRKEHELEGERKGGKTFRKRERWRAEKRKKNEERKNKQKGHMGLWKKEGERDLEGIRQDRKRDEREKNQTQTRGRCYCER